MLSDVYEVKEITSVDMLEHYQMDFILNDYSIEDVQGAWVDVRKCEISFNRATIQIKNVKMMIVVHNRVFLESADIYRVDGKWYIKAEDLEAMF